MSSEQEKIEHMEGSAWREIKDIYKLDEKQRHTDRESFYNSELFTSNDSLDENVNKLFERAQIIVIEDESTTTPLCHAEFAKSVPRLLAVARSLSHTSNVEMHDILYVLAQFEHSEAHRISRDMGSNLTSYKSAAILLHTHRSDQFLKSCVDLLDQRATMGLPIQTRIDGDIMRLVRQPQLM